MADQYGIDDFSGLNGDEQNTVRNIAKAFKASSGSIDRALQRNNLYGAISAPQRASMLKDLGLEQAVVSTAALNEQQLMKMGIDATHATPHGFGANVKAYGPGVLGAISTLPMLFGKGAFEKGMIPSAIDYAKKGYGIANDYWDNLFGLGKYYQPSYVNQPASSGWRTGFGSDLEPLQSRYNATFANEGFGNYPPAAYTNVPDYTSYATPSSIYSNPIPNFKFDPNWEAEPQYNFDLIDYYMGLT